MIESCDGLTDSDITQCSLVLCWPGLYLPSPNPAPAQEAPEPSVNSLNNLDLCRTHSNIEHA